MTHLSIAQIGGVLRAKILNDFEQGKFNNMKFNKSNHRSLFGFKKRKKTTSK